MANLTAADLAALLMPSALQHSAANGDDTYPFVETGFGSTGFLIVCSALVMIMTPAVGLLYSGLSRSHHALSIIMICCLSYAVVTVQWVLWGFSLAFSENAYSGFIGNLHYVGLDNLSWQALPLTAPAVPGIAFACYQLQFATVTVALIFGSVIERVRIVPTVLFMFVWTTAIYDPIAYWTWGARGWIKNMSCLSTLKEGDTPCLIGGLDFAGGGPVHMASGAASLAFCIFLGVRKRALGSEFEAHNITSIFLGTALLWMGWFGFNAGSALSATPRAAYAGMATTVSASAGALAWVLVEYLRTGTMSGIAFCSGAIAALVGVTPASGFVNAWSAILIGIITAVVCAFAVRAKHFFGYDDSADAWGVHGVGGFVGNILTGLFTKKSIALLDGTVIDGGVFFDGKWSLLGYNVASAVATVAYSFVGTMVILFVINKIPGFQFRMEEDEELKGDITNMGEMAYAMPILASYAKESATALVRGPSQRSQGRVNVGQGGGGQTAAFGGVARSAPPYSAGAASCDFRPPSPSEYSEKNL